MKGPDFEYAHDEAALFLGLVEGRFCSLNELVVQVRGAGNGIDAIDGFDVNTIPQEISYLSHFNSNETSGPAKEFIDNYNAKYDEEKEPLNQFGASAYDCVYAIYEALKVAIENGEEITVTMAPSEFCDILTEVFDGDFTFRGITGKCENGEKSYISWDEVGMVEKEAVKYIVKEKTAE